MPTACPVCNGTINDNESSCPSCGFKLLGSTEEFQPISLDGEATKKPKKEAKGAQIASLTVISGPQIGTSYRLDDKQLAVGRSPHCDIFLNDMTVSRNHALIFPKDGHFYISDQKSYNGIWINNDSIEEALLHDGDIVQIGAFVLKFEE
ncbi:MAG: FHA domain-containing protein [Eggerthellaceae bacterium]|nr:FHA domain-containing protein [Eggerthellaceae bacterium]